MIKYLSNRDIPGVTVIFHLACFADTHAGQVAEDKDRDKGHNQARRASTRIEQG